MSPRIPKAIPAVARAMTLRRNSFGLLYSACRSKAGEALIEAAGSSEGERRQLHNRAALERGLMGAQAGAGPVGRLFRVGHRIAVFEEGRKKLMAQVRMRAAVARA